MAVPSHDQRDFEYAVAHRIPMIQVIEGADVSEKAFEKYDYLGKGCKLLNSEEFTGLTVEEAKKAITDKLVNMGVAKKTVNYHFREWIFARQRYWGEPMPVVYLEDGTIHILDDAELPLVLPELTEPLTVRISMGVVYGEIQTDTPLLAYLEQADKALYAAKQQGKDQVVFRKMVD